MNQTPVNPTSTDESRPNNTSTFRIVVAVDTSRQSQVALEAAADLAALLHAELEGLFIEDINLLHLCGFPFCSQVGSYTATVRRVDNLSMERELRALASVLRQQIEQTALRAQVPWRFQVRRGSVAAELLHAAQTARMLSLGRAGSSRRMTLGSTAQAVVAQATRPLLILGESRTTQPPLVLFYTGDESSRRALALAVQLAPRYEQRLQIWLRAAAEQSSATEAELREEIKKLTSQEDPSSPLQVEIIDLADHYSLSVRLHMADTNTVILPRAQAGLIDQHTGPTILVP
jgi:nucleotide-binding universal stress UspA family protein